jgi:hypothetical protein
VISPGFLLDSDAPCCYILDRQDLSLARGPATRMDASWQPFGLPMEGTGQWKNRLALRPNSVGVGLASRDLKGLAMRRRVLVGRSFDLQALTSTAERRQSKYSVSVGNPIDIRVSITGNVEKSIAALSRGSVTLLLVCCAAAPLVLAAGAGVVTGDFSSVLKMWPLVSPFLYLALGSILPRGDRRHRDDSDSS